MVDFLVVEVALVVLVVALDVVLVVALDVVLVLEVFVVDEVELDVLVVRDEVEDEVLDAELEDVFEALEDLEVELSNMLPNCERVKPVGTMESVAQKARG